MTTIRDYSMKPDGFERERAIFFSSKNFNDLCASIRRMYEEGEKFFIASGLHPIHGWPSAQLELHFLSNFSDKSDEFKAFLSVPHTNKDIAERFDIDQSAASLFLYRLEKIGVVSTQKIGRFKGYVWKSDKINRQALISEFGQLFSKYPPAEPGALVYEPLKAAKRGR